MMNMMNINEKQPPRISSQLVVDGTRPRTMNDFLPDSPDYSPPSVGVPSSAISAARALSTDASRPVAQTLIIDGGRSPSNVKLDAKRSRPSNTSKPDSMFTVDLTVSDEEAVDSIGEFDEFHLNHYIYSNFRCNFR